MNLDTAVIGLSALMLVCLVPAARDVRLIDYLLNLTAGQALVVGWAPLVSACFLFIWASNWIGPIFPWPFIEIPVGELAAPTNDINVTSFLALCASHGYTFAGFDEYRGRYPGKYLKPVAFLLPINILEEFSKPLSLSFRLFGNILADELTLNVLYGLVPVGIPIPVFLLGLFTSGIQALVFATLAAAYLGESMEVLD